MNITKGMLKELIRATLSESPDLDSYRSYDKTLISSEQIRQVEKARSAAELQAILVIDAYKSAWCLSLHASGFTRK